MSTIYWDEEIETLPRVGLESIQLKRLQSLINRVYRKVEPYREKMIAAGVRPEDIRELDDLQKLPFTTKEDLRFAQQALKAVPKPNLLGNLHPFAHEEQDRWK